MRFRSTGASSPTSTRGYTGCVNCTRAPRISITPMRTPSASATPVGRPGAARSSSLRVALGSSKAASVSTSRVSSERVRSRHRGRIRCRRRGELFDDIIDNRACAEIVQFLCELLHEQRIAVGDLTQRAGWCRVPSRCQVARRGRPPRAPPAARCVRPSSAVSTFELCDCGGEFPRLEWRSTGGENEKRRPFALREPCHMTHDVEGGLVRPLHVVDDEEQRLFACEVHDRLREREQQTSAIVRIEPGRVIARIGIEASCEHDRVLGSAVDEQGKEGVAARQGTEAARARRTGPIRTRALPPGSSSAKRASSSRSRGLADSERTLQQHGRSTPSQGSMPVAAECGQLARAPDECERCSSGRGRDAPPGAARKTGTAFRGRLTSRKRRRSRGADRPRCGSRRRSRCAVGHGADGRPARRARTLPPTSRRRDRPSHASRRSDRRWRAHECARPGSRVLPK